MVKIMENPIEMDDLGVITPIFGNTHMWEKHMFQATFHRPIKRSQKIQQKLGFLLVKKSLSKSSCHMCHT